MEVQVLIIRELEELDLALLKSTMPRSSLPTHCDGLSEELLSYSRHYAFTWTNSTST